MKFITYPLIIFCLLLSGCSQNPQKKAKRLHDRAMFMTLRNTHNSKIMAIQLLSKATDLQPDYYVAHGEQKKMRLEKMPLEDAQEIWIYNYFPLRGYTTAGAYGEIIRLEEENAPKFKLEQNDVDSLCCTLREALPEKLFHTKIGQNLIFAEVILKDGQRSMILITPYVISIEFIKKNYWIRDENNKQWLFEFRDRVRSGQYK
jgi:hypothetical protein